MYLNEDARKGRFKEDEKSVSSLIDKQLIDK